MKQKSQILTKKTFNPYIEGLTYLMLFMISKNYFNPHIYGSNNWLIAKGYTSLNFNPHTKA